MIIYADYEFYRSEYGGNLTENEFRSAILPASTHVQRITFGRADQCKDREEVKLATCAICDVIVLHDKSMINGQMIASENNDGYSVSYVSPSKSAEGILREKIYSAAELYLSSTDLLDWGL